MKKYLNITNISLITQLIMCAVIGLEINPTIGIAFALIFFLLSILDRRLDIQLRMHIDELGIISSLCKDVEDLNKKIEGKIEVQHEPYYDFRPHEPGDGFDD